MFKLVFQAFIMLSLTSAYVIFRMTVLMSYQRIKTEDHHLLFLTCISDAGLFCNDLSDLAVNAYYNNFKTYQGLNGIKYLKTLYPDDYLAIQWLNQNIQGQPVILEAQGDSYTDYARISSNTGLPTILGWTVHEMALARNVYPSNQIPEVKSLYETTDCKLPNNCLLNIMCNTSTSAHWNIKSIQFE